MKYWLVLVVLAVSPVLVSAQEKMKIGFVDIQKAITESAAGKKAKARFDAQVKKAESELLKEKQELERLKADFDKKGPLLKEDERRNLEADLERRFRQYQRTGQDHQQELRQKGIATEIARDVLDEADLDEAAAAEELARKRLATYAGEDPAVVRRRLGAYLARRGYGFDIVRAALDRAMGEPEDVEEDVLDSGNVADAPS